MALRTISSPLFQSKESTRNFRSFFFVTLESDSVFDLVKNGQISNTAEGKFRDRSTCQKSGKKNAQKKNAHYSHWHLRSISKQAARPATNYSLVFPPQITALYLLYSYSYLRSIVEQTARRATNYSLKIYRNLGLLEQLVLQVPDLY